MEKKELHSEEFQDYKDKFKSGKTVKCDKVDNEIKFTN